MSDKNDWKKRVAESDGKSVFVPEELMEKAKEWKEMSDKLQDLLLQASRMEIEARTLYNALAVEVRRFLDKNGRKDIWTFDMGIDNDALKEDIFIFNVVDPNKGGRTTIPA